LQAHLGIQHLSCSNISRDSIFPDQVALVSWLSIIASAMIPPFHGWSRDGRGKRTGLSGSFSSARIKQRGWIAVSPQGKLNSRLSAWRTGGLPRVSLPDFAYRALL